MKEPNCFPPAEYNPSSLTPTSLSQSLMAMHELLYPRPQLSLPIPSGSQETMYLLLNPVAAPLPNTSRTCSSSPHCFLFCDLFSACSSLLSPIQACSPCKLLPVSPFIQEQCLSPYCLMFNSSRALILPRAGFPESPHPSHHLVFPRECLAPHKTI